MTRFLALGDSYTIGEGIDPSKRWPTVIAHALKIDELQIIARTGWTTDELSAAIDEVSPRGPFHLVTLLIGVNDQYRGHDPEEYRPKFVALLNRAIAFAWRDPRRVVVVSIPDWSVTPFAEGRDRAAIARAIDRYNAINREEATRVGARYVDITEISRSDGSLVAEDRLHPSAEMHARWVRAIQAEIERALTVSS